jgi:hypothetical protein
MNETIMGDLIQFWIGVITNYDSTLTSLKYLAWPIMIRSDQDSTLLWRFSIEDAQFDVLSNIKPSLGMYGILSWCL